MVIIVWMLVENQQRNLSYRVLWDVIMDGIGRDEKGEMV